MDHLVKDTNRNLAHLEKIKVKEEKNVIEISPSKKLLNRKLHKK